MTLLQILSFRWFFCIPYQQISFFQSVLDIFKRFHRWNSGHKRKYVYDFAELSQRIRRWGFELDKWVEDLRLKVFRSIGKEVVKHSTESKKIGTYGQVEEVILINGLISLVEIINKPQYFFLLLHIALISRKKMVKQILWQIIKRRFYILSHFFPLLQFFLSHTHIVFNF